MIRIVTFIFMIVMVASCSTTKSIPISSSYWQKKPDLSKVVYSGGNGASADSAIVIKNAENERNGVASEYNYISIKHGEKSVNWKFIAQSTNTSNRRKLDIIQIQTIPQNEKITYYFDITDYYGKF